VIDPGVGTDRKSIVMRSRSGHYFVTPDNGTLTLVARSLGIESIREINEAVNRRQNSGKSYTFHGRDVYAYTAARLAAGSISFEEVGQKLPDTVVSIPFEAAQLKEDSITGGIPVLDVEYGNVWTNIPDSLVRQLIIGNNSKLLIRIYYQNTERYYGSVPYVNTFGAVGIDSVLAYSNSLQQLSFGINQASFAEEFKVGSGPDWKVSIKCLSGCK
jgi:S-adenosylmethionine hydrolase